ncbi:MAG: NADH:ubiquinone reductase (Na(+)-transporting) subunit C [Prevotella sp.]|uniref:NADH:ubiquinone reductase (Na(+)-transporting) subunit C n=1 Tax=Hallella absiana TaxID=2925336 RepID=UPI0021C7495E|nr:NADH:ubiquinone reductase (Na(+)-transporting) subunit C [Hallella absiana]MDD5822760.1 NADH:ubiquinone reductase (Na(+)-transporting) subunit C [Prevotella sp.]
MKTNSNSYTIVYAAVLVVIVAFLLAFVFQALRPAQEANVALDKQKQILYSLNIRGLQDQAAAAKYKEVVTADEIIDANGNVVDKGSKGGTAAGFKLNSGDFKAGKLAVYVCSVNGQTKYVIPVYGMGLWGPISGYIALNDDKSTIYGAYFNHESETAGLGAEIKDNQKWQEQFQGKKLFKGADRNAIAISVLKKRDSNDPNSVDAVTGATLTSNGVTDMLHDCLGQYIKFLNAK